MRKTCLLLLLPLCISVAGQAAAPAQAHGEVRLARETRGLTADAPRRCLFLRDVISSRVVANTGIIYETGGHTVYVNRPTAGASALKAWTIPVSREASGQLCEGDPIRLHDRQTGMQTGFATLGAFTPYRKPPRRGR
jgi:hypothetical protein